MAKTKVLDQIEEAKRTVESWPEWLRESVKIEGTDPYYEQARKNPVDRSDTGKSDGGKEK
jgi:hypothetical protein